MINNEEILKSFSGDAPIFALPNFVMFPKTAYSFNVFEPRYKEMVSDILKINKNFFFNGIHFEKFMFLKKNHFFLRKINKMHKLFSIYLISSFFSVFIPCDSLLQNNFYWNSFTKGFKSQARNFFIKGITFHGNRVWWILKNIFKR